MRKSITMAAACAALFLTGGLMAQDFCFSEKWPHNNGTTDYGPDLGNPSYFDVTIGSQRYEGWCLAGDLHIDYSGTYTGHYVQLAIANIPNIDQVLWVLNQHYPGKSSTLNSTTFVFDDVQQAIWYLIGSKDGGGADHADTTRVSEILTAAALPGNGKGFVPQCGQISAVMLQPTAIGCNGNPATIQPILIEIPVECVKLACIGDFVWNDVNNNGKQETGEPGISGVTVELVHCVDGAVAATTTTDANGKYLFSNVVPGSYQVHVVAPAGYLFSPANTTTDDADSDADQNGLMPCTDLAAGECDLTWDAGLYLPPPPSDGCALTPGYWMNHPNSWPVDSLTIGGITYTKAQAIALIKAPVKGDVRLTMFAQLASTLLNLNTGSNDSCIADTIAAADAWWSAYGGRAVFFCGTWKLGGKEVPGGSPAWCIGAPLASNLDAYNNGKLCVPHCDSIPESSCKAKHFFSFWGRH
jgi:hypothetical protein